MPLKKILFICSMNRWRSPTAEHIFAQHPGLETSSAGTNHNADNPVTGELIETADIIFVMEKTHKAKLTKHFSTSLKGKKIICLNIPDKFKYMDEELIATLRTRVTPFL